MGVLFGVRWDAVCRYSLGGFYLNVEEEKEGVGVWDGEERVWVCVFRGGLFMGEDRLGEEVGKLLVVRDWV